MAINILKMSFREISLILTDHKLIFDYILDIFVLLVLLEILSHYSDIDVSPWLREDVQ